MIAKTTNINYDAPYENTRDDGRPSRQDNLSMGNSAPGKGKHPLSEDEKKRNDEIWLLMLPRTSRMANRLSATDWEDMVSEAYIQFRGRNRWEEPYDGLVKKYLMEAGRKLGLWVQTDGLAPDSYTEGDNDIEDVAHNNLRASAIHSALGKLSPLCQTIIRMRYFADLPCRAVAERLGIPMAEIYHAEYSALAILSRLLRDFAPAPEPMDFGPLFGGYKEEKNES